MFVRQYIHIFIIFIHLLEQKIICTIPPRFCILNEFHRYWYLFRNVYTRIIIRETSKPSSHVDYFRYAGSVLLFMGKVLICVSDFTISYLCICCLVREKWDRRFVDHLVYLFHSLLFVFSTLNRLFALTKEVKKEKKDS